MHTLEYDQVQIGLLLQAYIRRKQWEHKALAIAVVNTLAEAMNGESNPKRKASRSVGLDDLMRLATSPVVNATDL